MSYCGIRASRRSDFKFVLTVPAIVDLAFTKELVLNQVESAADWRRDKAEEYPADLRNAESAEALDLLAENLRALPLEEIRLLAERHAQVMALDDGGSAILNLIEEESRVYGRYGGFGGGDGDAREFLLDLVELREGYLIALEEGVASDQTTPQVPS